MQPTSESEVAFSREHKKTVPNASQHVSIICVAYSCQSIIRSILYVFKLSIIKSILYVFKLVHMFIEIILQLL